MDDVEVAGKTETTTNQVSDTKEEKSSDDGVKTIGLLGSTGKVGAWVMESLLEKKYNVRVLVRKAAKLDDYKEKENLTIIQGSCLELDDVTNFVTGCDVIISCLGSPSPDIIIMEKAAKILVSALQGMDDDAVPRVLWISTVGVNDAIPQGHKYGCSNGCCPSCGWCCGYGCNGCMIFCCLIPCVMSWDLWNDLGLAEDVLMADEVIKKKTVIVRSCNMWPADGGGPTFSDGWRETGGAPDMLEYTLRDALEPPPGVWIRRQALAKFFVDAVEETKWDGNAVSVFPDY